MLFTTKVSGKSKQQYISGKTKVWRYKQVGVEFSFINLTRGKYRQCLRWNEVTVIKRRKINKYFIRITLQLTSINDGKRT